MLNSPSPDDEVPLRPSQLQLLYITPIHLKTHMSVTSDRIEREVGVAAVSGDWSTVRTLISRKVGLRIVRDSLVPA